MQSAGPSPSVRAGLTHPSPAEDFSDDVTAKSNARRGAAPVLTYRNPRPAAEKNYELLPQGGNFPDQIGLRLQTRLTKTLAEYRAAMKFEHWSQGAIDISLEGLKLIRSFAGKLAKDASPARRKVEVLASEDRQRMEPGPNGN